MGMFELIKLLDAAKVDYVLVGGLAVALHGYSRNTMDVDVVLAMDDENIRRFIDGARRAGLRPVAPIDIESLSHPELLDQWHQEKGMLAFGLSGEESQATVLDVLIKPLVPYADLRRDAVIVAVGELKIPLASIDHLIAMKTDSGRSKDAIDIEELTKLRGRSQP